MKNKKVYENESWYKEEKKLKTKRVLSICVTILSFASTLILFNFSHKMSSDRRNRIKSDENYISYTQQMKEENPSEATISPEKFVKEYGTDEQKAMWEQSKKTQDALFGASLASYALFAVSSHLAIRYNSKYTQVEHRNTRLKQEAVNKAIEIKEEEIKNMLNPFHEL